nr:glycosyltransferase family 4 protein [Mycolicibacterium hippocampi]
MSPGLRPLARTYVESLRALGAEVLLVTSDLHPESDEAREYEVVLLGRPIPTADWWRVSKAYRQIRRFDPDVIVTEFLRDPRWRIFSDLAPRIRLLHDDVPHDSTHVAPWWNRAFFERWDDRAAATIVFSNYVAESVRSRQTVAESRLYVAPLTSDLPLALIPERVPATERRNVVLIGRQRPYKNHEVVFAAWESHTRGGCWPGDELILFGDGEIQCALPNHARWVKDAFRYETILSEVSRARASVVHSRTASQSGVQVMSLQLGVPTLVSTAGGLAEYQPDGLCPIDIDDVEGLSRAMDRLAEPAEIEAQSRRASAYFMSRFSPELAASRLLEIFESVLQSA